MFFVVLVGVGLNGCATCADCIDILTKSVGINFEGIPDIYYRRTNRFVESGSSSGLSRSSLGIVGCLAQGGSFRITQSRAILIYISLPILRPPISWQLKVIVRLIHR